MRLIFAHEVTQRRERAERIRNSILAVAFAGAIGYATNNFEPTENIAGKVGAYLGMAVIGYSLRTALGFSRG